MTKGTNKILIAFLFLIVLSLSNSQAARRCPSYFANIEASDLILLAECIDTSIEQINIEYSFRQGEIFSGSRFGIYKVIKSWKRNYDEDLFKLDLKPINLIYNPEEFNRIELTGNRVPFAPTIGEKVYLFIKDGNITHLKQDGIIRISESYLMKFNDVIDRMVEIEKLNLPDRIDAFTASMKKKNPLLRLMAMLAAESVSDKTVLDNYDVLMSCDSENVRLFALSKIGGITDSSFVDRIVPFLYDPSPLVQYSALSAINNYGISVALKVIYEHYNSVSSNLRDGMIALMIESKCNSCEDFYYNAAMDTSLTVRPLAILTLAQIKSPALEEILPELLLDFDPLIRAQTAKTIGFYYDEDYIDLLKIALIIETVENVKQEIIKAIFNINNTVVITEEPPILEPIIR